jgi:hypothetical protein
MRFTEMSGSPHENTNNDLIDNENGIITGGREANPRKVIDDRVDASKTFESDTANLDVDSRLITGRECISGDALHNTSQLISKLVTAEGDVHVYPMLCRHPFHRFFGPLGLNWLFGLIFPYRAKVNKDNIDNYNDVVSNSNRNYSFNNDCCDTDDGRATDDTDGDSRKSDQNRNNIPLHLLTPEVPGSVHSKAARDAVSEMATFILQIRYNKSLLENRGDRT